MTVRTILGLLLVATAGVTGGPLPAAVWPPPVSASCTGSGGSAFSSSLSFRLSGHGENSPVAHNATARYLPILTEGAAASGEITSLSVFVDVAEERLGLGTNYAYEVSVNGSEVQISARSPFGVAYGLETLSQFIVQHSGGGGGGAALRCEKISVVDEPAFPHRGLSIDSARRFYPVELIKQTLIGMAMTKQNVLHLHLSDSPCWRVESKIYPRLTRECPMVKGAMNEDGMFYSQADIAEIVEFARVRGVRVIPEFDVPGHAGGLCSQLVDEGLQCCLKTGTATIFLRHFNTCMIILPSQARDKHNENLTKEPVSAGPRGNDDQILNDAAGVGLKIIKAIFTEMSALFPDEVMHVGCDETTVTNNCTLSMTTSFEEEILKHVASLGKAPIAWEEALLTGAAHVEPSMTLQLWTPRKEVTWTNATNLGFNVLRSDFNIFYLDYDRRGTAEKMWFNITAGESATPAQIRRVHGGESAMWGDAYTHAGGRAGAASAACLFPGSRDRDFGVSAQGCIWPRAAVAAGTWWGYNTQTKDLDVCENGSFEPFLLYIDAIFLPRQARDKHAESTQKRVLFSQVATFNATHDRLVSRGIASCPCSNLTHNGCNQQLRCGKAYCSNATAQ
jgi:hypothetical protein